MKKTPKQDITRLPQWAQRRIAKLEADVEYHKAPAFQAAQGPSGSRVFIEDHEGKRGLPDNVKVGFRIQGDRRVIEVSRDEEWVRISSYNTGLVIEPEVSNVIRVRPQP